MSVLDFGEQVATQSATEKHVIDPWSFLDYKTTFTQRSPSWAAPSWVGLHWRRLQAYRILEDLYRNSARYWLSTTDEEVRRDRREYGDPFVVVEQYLNSLLGDDQSIIVPAAAVPNPPAPAKAFLDMLTVWAENQQFDAKVEEGERNAIKLGDAVYVLGDPRRGEPIVESWDPGFYFPVLDPAAPASQFPRKIHLAYEFEEPAPGTTNVRRFVRRHTYELIPLVQVDEEGEPLYDEDGEPIGATVALPWNTSAVETCMYSCAVWELSNIKQPEKADDLTWGTATRIEQEPIDLELDFIPVVHIPGLTPSLNEHYGFSVLSPVAQLLEDVVANDTDLQKSAATTGSPPIALSGSTLPTDDRGRITAYGPGEVFQVGDGTATLLDTSTALDALLKMKDSQLSRLSVNSRIPESLLGRVKPSEVPSGIALTISFGPHIGVIRKMRKIRRRKYALLLKFVGRFMMRRAQDAPGEIFPVEYHFGSFMPSDRMEVMNLVTQGIQSKPPVISLQTAVRMLVEAGFPIDDAVEEVRQIIESDYETANQMMDATGDPAAVRHRLGLSAQPAAVPPAEAGA